MATLRDAATEVARAVARAHRCEASVCFELGEPVLVNDERLVSDARELLTGFGAILAPDLRSCGADDFSYLGCQAVRRGQAMSQPEARIATRGYEH